MVASGDEDAAEEQYEKFKFDENREYYIGMIERAELNPDQYVKEGKITLEEGKEFLSNYRSGLYGYTYLDY